MESPSSSLCYTLTALFLFHHLATCSMGSTSTLPTKTSNTEYIKNSCNTTLYPKLCYQSLSIYAQKIKTSPKLLATTALSVTLSAAASASRAMKNLSKSIGLKARETAAMVDCVELVGDSVDELRKSMEEMNHGGGASNFEREMSDIETWVSAALTDDDTCMDEFAGKGMDGEVKNKVRRLILNVAHLTSVALALVNNYADS